MNEANVDVIYENTMRTAEVGAFAEQEECAVGR